MSKRNLRWLVAGIAIAIAAAAFASAIRRSQLWDEPAISTADTEREAEQPQPAER